MTLFSYACGVTWYAAWMTVFCFLGYRREAKLEKIARDAIDLSQQAIDQNINFTKKVQDIYYEMHLEEKPKERSLH